MLYDAHGNEIERPKPMSLLDPGQAERFIKKLIERPTLLPWVTIPTRAEWEAAKASVRWF